MGDDEQMNSILAAARARGDVALVGKILPPSLDKFAIYTGLLQSFLELGKLIATEERDLNAIAAHHEIEMARIQAAMRQVEAAMLADFHRDESLRTSTFESINLLIVAGQYEVASEFHARFIQNLSRPALETLIDHRNAVTGAKGTKWRRI